MAPPPSVADADDGLIGGLIYVWMTFASNTLCCLMLVSLIMRMKYERRCMMQGRPCQTHILILPAYENLLWFMAFYFFSLATMNATLTPYLRENPKERNELMTLQATSFALIGIYSLLPAILLQHTLTWRAYLNITIVMLPWVIGNFVLIIVLYDYDDCVDSSSPTFNVTNYEDDDPFLCEDQYPLYTQLKVSSLEFLFALSTPLPPLLIHLLTLTGCWKSRIELR